MQLLRPNLRKYDWYSAAMAPHLYNDEAVPGITCCNDNTVFDKSCPLAYQIPSILAKTATAAGSDVFPVVNREGTACVTAPNSDTIIATTSDALHGGDGSVRGAGGIDIVVSTIV